MTLPPAQFFVGLDWAAESHTVCVINAEGNPLAQFTVAHSTDGIALLLRRLAKFGDPIDLPVGIGRPDGRLVDLLLEAGHPVVPVSPTPSRPGARARCVVGGEVADAAVIAEYVRVRSPAQGLLC